MLRSKNLLSASELFEELKDEVSEKITGGANLLEVKIDGLELLKIVNVDILSQISKQLGEQLPKSGNSVAVSCVSVGDKKLGCVLLEAGKEVKKFDLML